MCWVVIELFVACCGVVVYCGWCASFMLLVMVVLLCGVSNVVYGIVVFVVWGVDLCVLC